MVSMIIMMPCLVSKFFLLFGRRAKKMRRMVAEVELARRAREQTTSIATVCPNGTTIAGTC